MTPERWQQIKAVLDAAVARSSTERDAFLAAACAGDADLRREVDSLLASHEQAGAAFLELQWGGCDPAIRSDEPDVAAGTRIGSYCINERIGRGGMGDVFAAVRADGQYEQRVALKLVRPGLAAPDVMERFRVERQILATLDHPNIARLLDGGSTGSGAPYLVMEFVDGIPVDAFCGAHALSTADRLRLVLPICDAVQYAHQRLVIHRDIKPGNILVTAVGVPKLLDFGIAKVLDPGGSTADTMLRPFTPEYASPEQVRGEPVSTATDVYALGVVLYRLLTGRSPYRLERPSSGELADAIVGQEPERPGAHQPLHGDLDAILLKALRKEADRRYQSVEQFAEDIRRHLDALPVSARKGTWRYRVGRFVRRHRPGVAAAALAAVALVAGLGVAVREARVAEANRQRADARFRDVRRLANSLIFEIQDSIENVPGTTAAQVLVLKRSLEYLDSLARESGNEPDLVRELATAYDRIAGLQGDPFKMQLGDPHQAVESFQKAIALREALARANPGDRRDQLELAVSYHHFAGYQAGAGDLASGFSWDTRALTILEREIDRAPRDVATVAQTAAVLTRRGMMQTGNGLMARVGSVREGIADMEHALRLAEHGLEVSPTDAALLYLRATLNVAIGSALLKLGDRPEAIVRLTRGLDLFEPMARSGSDARAMFNRSVAYGLLGDAMLIEGRLPDATPYYARYLETAAGLAAADRSNESFQRTEALALAAMGHALIESGRTGEGLPYIRRALAKIDDDKTNTPLIRSVDAFIRDIFGEALERDGKLREASRQYALTKQKMAALRASGINDARIAGYFAAATDRLAATCAAQRDWDAASHEYEEARRVLEPLVASNPDDYELAYLLAETYTAEGTIAAARAGRARHRDDKLAGWRSAAARFRQSLAVWNAVPHPARTSTSGFEVTVPSEVASRLTRCDREIRVLGERP